MTRAEDALRTLAAANPVPPAEVERLRLAEPSRTPWPGPPPFLTVPAAHGGRRRIAGLVLAGVAAVAVAAPALGMRAEVASLFGISNRGTVVRPEQLTAREVAALRRIGFLGDVRFLGARGGIPFYVARPRAGRRCFATGGGSAGARIAGSCVAASSAQPVLDLSQVRPAVRGGVVVWRLEGFAGDGVGSVAVVAADGRRFATRPVGNIYLRPALPAVRAVAIEARDAHARLVYRKPLVTAP